MGPDLFWVPGPWSGRLAISTRPRGGDWLEDEVCGWRDAGVDMVVSLLDAKEETELDSAAEGRLIEGAGIRFVSYPIADLGVPASRTVAAFLAQVLNRSLADGQNVVVHCRQGVGRSGMMAAGALIVAGMNAPAAVQAVSAARGVEVPETAAQRRWLEQLAASREVGNAPSTARRP